MKHFIFIAAFCFANLLAYSQCPITFTYDAAGNRTSRTKSTACIEQKKSDVLNAQMGLSAGPVVSPLPNNNGSPVQQQLGTAAQNQSLSAGSMALGDHRLELFPNPTKGNLSINISNPETLKNCSILITDLNGRVVFRSSATQSVYTPDLSDQPAGSYIVNISLNGTSGTFQVIKE